MTPRKKAAIVPTHILAAARAKQNEEANTDRHRQRQFADCHTPCARQGRHTNTPGCLAWEEAGRAWEEARPAVTNLAEEAAILGEGHLLVSDRVTKVELQRRLGVQAEAIRRYRGELGNLEAEVARLRTAVAGHPILAKAADTAQRELQVALTLVARQRREIEDHKATIQRLLVKKNDAERHLHTVIDMASASLLPTSKFKEDLEAGWSNSPLSTANLAMFDEVDKVTDGVTPDGP